MSLPYESNPTDWAAIRVIDHWVEYPFTEFWDPNSREYKMLCMCKVDEYVANTPNKVMDTAANAGVIELPFPADSSAYFVGDDNFNATDGGTMTFVRTFATVPSGYSTSLPYTHTYPGKREYYDRASTDANDENQAMFLNTQSSPLPPTLIRDPLTLDVLAKVTYSYHYSTQQGVDVTLDTLFEITQDSSFEKLTHNSVTYYPSWPDLEGLNYVCDSLLVSWIDTRVPGSLSSYKATSPSLTTYETAVTNGDLMVIKSFVEHYKGNIYRKTKIEVPYK